MEEVIAPVPPALSDHPVLPVGTVITSTSPHFSSKTDLWETPVCFFKTLNQEFDFSLDVCALPENTKCSRYFSPNENGLDQNWIGVCWMNPPYGREIGKWVSKAYESGRGGATVVCLLPARTDTRWWHRWVMHASEIRFVQGRLKFGTSRNSAPFPSAVVVFRPPVTGDSQKSTCPLISVTPRCTTRQRSNLFVSA